ncbi:MAG: transposase [Gammaproteobacteria bacterium]|nr:transposase [Gammaproteobacteria bacterium]
MLQEIVQLQPGLQPRELITDFERAAINAFQNAFPGLECTGCNFHFNQCGGAFKVKEFNRIT